MPLNEYFFTDQVAEPIMETEAAKTVSKGIHSIKNDVVGITGNAYFAEYNTKDVRDQKKKDLMAKRKQHVKVGPDGLPLVGGPVQADESSTGVVMHKSSRLVEAWDKFKSESSIGQSWYSYKKSLQEKDTPLLQFWRNLKESTKSEESEGAKVVRLIRTVDPAFEQNAFLDEVAHFIIPELLEANLLANVKVLKEWVTEAVQIYLM
jgi:mitochondrial import inner membrane translocase subunit TIM44